MMPKPGSSREYLERPGRQLTEEYLTIRPRLIVNADDYAFTPGVSRGIRELLAARRISATSVMAASEFWPEEAPALRAVAGDADIGIHITLTDQTPLGAMPSFASAGRFPALPSLMKAAIARRLPLVEIETEIERQLARFIEHYGAPPSHIDGHHHVHQMPGIRDIVIRQAARLKARYVRCCAEPLTRIRRRGVAPLKTVIIGSFGDALRRRARAANVATNSGFSGVYDFRAPGFSMEQLFSRFLQEAGVNHLVMCHPGFVDADLATRDHVTSIREDEHRFLMSPRWPELIADSGLELGPFVSQR
jgi:chitin disaccharide deacetylase